MSKITAEQRRQLEQLERPALEKYQLKRFNELLTGILPHNCFYSEKLAHCEFPLESLQQLGFFPHTSKEELAITHGPLSLPKNLTWPLDNYVHFHQTSGTHGRPLTVLDTESDWQWWIDSWQFVLDAANIASTDRALLAFSFGPFIGFWSAHDALVDRGTMVIPCGGMNTVSRLDLISRTGANVLFCTPTYALHMADVARNHSINLTSLKVRKIVVAGEPGGSVPATRNRIEKAWNAKVTDHSGASEVGPWGYGDQKQQGLHVLETEFIAEFVNVSTGEPAASGELSHLILTSLGRLGAPVIRYRTGDLVRPVWPEAGPNRFVFLEGGVVGRADDMMIVRGVNIFPSSVEQIMHSFPEVVEYRLTVSRNGEMDELVIEVEDHLNQPNRIAEELSVRLGLKVAVKVAPPLSLPRFEGKGQRFVDLRK